MDAVSVLRTFQKIGDWLKEEELKMFSNALYAIMCSGVSSLNYKNLHGLDCDRYVKTAFLNKSVESWSSFSSKPDYYLKNHEFFITGEQLDSFILVSMIWFLFMLFWILYLCSADDHHQRVRSA